MELSLALATEADRDDLAVYFKHYAVEEILRHRVCCYTSHNFTVVAKIGTLVVGTIQWYVKENPTAGLVEFEEVYVKEECRGKGIGFRLTEFAIWSVRDYFNRIQIRPRKIYLFVGQQNVAARSLYEKAGFAFVSEAGNLFSETEIELLYSLSL